MAETILSPGGAINTGYEILTHGCKLSVAFHFDPFENGVALHLNKFKIKIHMK